MSLYSPQTMAVVIGATGGIGSALVQHLHNDPSGLQVLALSRRTVPALDLQDEHSIATAAAHVQTQCQALGLELRLVINATGSLHQVLAGKPCPPEKSWKELDPAGMAQMFAINATGPALLMKHFLPLLPRQGKAVFATLSAKVGSIGDNQLGGWYSYRASKAAQNQLVRTAAIELRRRHPQALCVALHPGTVDTALSHGFAKTGLDVVSPAFAATRLLQVIGQLEAKDSGGFFHHDGSPLPW